jgi:hypothetical protein
MKKAALDTQQAIRAQFAASNAGSFTSIPSWFQDQYVCAPQSDAVPDAAVLDIPAPAPGDATKIFAATMRMVDRLKALYDATPNAGESDQFALVLFTDGFDNYSWFDASALPARPVTAGGAAFQCTGPKATTRDDLLAKVRAFPQLKVHVIGLGNTIKASELGAIADAGHGRFVSNPDAGQVSSLFAEITREFTTVRRDGIAMPLPPADYEYVEEVSIGGASSRVRFRFRAGDAGATVRADTIAIE